MRIWWCQEHGIGDAAEPLPKFCWLSLAQRAPRPCRMVPMRLIPDNAETVERIAGVLHEWNLPSLQKARLSVAILAALDGETP